MSGDMDRMVLTDKDGVTTIIRRGRRTCPKCGTRWNSSAMAMARGPQEKAMCPRYGCDSVELGKFEPLGSLL